MEAPENPSELIEQLGDDVEDLEDALAPLLNYALSESASKLPLLDRAKLYVLATYAIESIIFSFLRLNGANAKEHPVFKELTRVKQYFEKIKVVENGKQGPNLRVDKGAAGRFIKHALAHQVARYHAPQPSEQAIGAAGHSAQATSNKQKFSEVEAQKPKQWRDKGKESGSDISPSDSSDDSDVSSEADPEPEPKAEPHKASAEEQPVLEPKAGEAPKKPSGASMKAWRNRRVKGKKAKWKGQAGGQARLSGSTGPVPGPSDKKKRKDKRTRLQEALNRKQSTS